MGENIERVARSIFDSVNERDVERGASLMAEECEFVEVPTGEVFRGPAGWRQNFDRWLGAFPDGRVEVTTLIASGEWAAVEYTGRGTNTAPFQGPAGEIPATGRSVEMQFCDVLHVRDGKVVEGRTYYDLASLLAQLGLMPEQAGAVA